MFSTARRYLTAASAGLAALALAGSALAAAYMKYEGVEGRFTSPPTAAEGHSDWIQVESVSFSAPPGCQPGGPGTVVARIQGGNNLRALGTAAVPRMIIDVDNPTGGSALRYELENTLISSIKPATPPGAGRRASDNVTFSFDKIRVIGANCAR